MNKRTDENIRYIAIANLLDRKIIVDYMPPSKKEKKSTVITCSNNNLFIFLVHQRNKRHNRKINFNFNNS